MYSGEKNLNHSSDISHDEWVSLSEAAREVPYSAEYLSLLARKKTLPAKKIRGVWYTTLPIVKEYMRRQMSRSLQDSSFAVSLAENPSARSGLFPSAETASSSRPDLATGFPTIITPEEAKKINENIFVENIISRVSEETPPAPAEDLSAEPAFSVVPSSLSLHPHLEKTRTLSDDALEFAENLVSAVEEETAKKKTWAETPFPPEEDHSPKDAENDGVLKIVSDEKTMPSQEDAYASILFQKFITSFTAYLDKEIETRESFLSRGWHIVRGAYGAVLSHKKLFSLFLIFLLVFTILPFRVVSAFFDSAYRGVAEVINDANTVLGFRPGTHANEILLLDQEGKIAIFGNVETEGQFKSFVEDGIAPIYVKSTTRAENLNADYLDDLSSEEFTLAFVTKNGNVTYDDVQLEGKVAVGQTLLVRGAANLLSSLQVDGELSVFGDTNLNKNLTVNGSSYFKALISAQDIAARHIYADRVNATELVADGVLSVHGNANVDGQIVVQGFGFFQGGVSGDTGTFRRGVSTGGPLQARGDVELGGTDSDIKLTSVLWSIDTEGNAVFGGNATVKDSLSVSATTSVNRLRASNIGIGTTTPGYEVGVVGSGLFEGLVIAYEGFVGNTLTATSTLSAEGLASFLSGFISSASSTISSTLHVLDALTASSTLVVDGLSTLYGGLLSTASSTIGGPLYVQDNLSASSTLTVGGLATFENGFISGASSSATTLSASDSLYASSSIAVDGMSLFALTGGSVGIGTTTPGTLLAVQGDAFINDLLTVGGRVNATSTLTVGDLSTLTGFISTASSTIGGPLYVQDNLSASSTLTLGGLGTLEGGAILGGASSTVSGTLSLSRNVIANGGGIDMGDAGTRFGIIYADEVNATTLVGTITGGNSSSTTFTINSENATADENDSFLAFERGTITPNALLQWDSTNKNFIFNFGVVTQASSTISGPFHVSDNLSASSTLTVASLATFDSGFISSASSTVASTLHISDAITGSSTLTIDGQCVTGDSELITAQGEKLRVDEVKGGEYVYSLDEKTGNLVPAKIIALLDMGVKEIWKMETEDGKTIRTTANHPYLALKKSKKTAIDESASESFVLMGNKSKHADEDAGDYQKSNENIEINRGLKDNHNESFMFFGIRDGSEDTDNGDGYNQQSAKNIEIGKNIVNVHSNYLINNEPKDQQNTDAVKPKNTILKSNVPPINGPTKNDAKKTWPISRLTPARNLSLSDDIYSYDSSKQNHAKSSLIEPTAYNGIKHDGKSQQNDSANQIKDFHNYNEVTSPAVINSITPYLARFRFGAIKENDAPHDNHYNTGNNINNDVVHNSLTTINSPYVNNGYYNTDNSISENEIIHISSTNFNPPTTHPDASVKPTANAIKLTFPETPGTKNPTILAKSNKKLESLFSWDLLNRVGIYPNDNAQQNTVKHAEWTKVRDLTEGDYIAVTDDNLEKAQFVKIKKITLLPPEQVYDLSIEDTHNFVANGIIAHNTYLNNLSTLNGFISTASSTVSAQLTTQGLQVEGVFNASSSSFFSGDSLFNGNIKIGLGSSTPTQTLTIEGGVRAEEDLEALNAFYVKPRTASYAGVIFNAAAPAPLGITKYDGFFWVVDESNTDIDKHTTAGINTGISFDTAASGNGSPYGITQHGGFFWVTDLVDAEIYKYTVGGVYTGVSFDTAASGNGSPTGITQYGGFFWVTDLADAEVYKYTVDGVYTGVSFDTAASGNGVPRGITQYGGFFWVTDGTDAEVYKYTVDGVYTGVSFDTAGSGNAAPRGITQYGGFFWVVDETDSDVYKYAIQTDTYVLGNSYSNLGTTTEPLTNTDSLASFGVGTSSPWGLLSVHASSTNILIDPLFVVASTTPLGTNDTLFVIKSSGNVGIASTSPAFLFSIDGAAYVSDTLFVGNAITATSTLTVGDLSTLTGFISTASSTIGGPFYVQDHLSASSTSSFGGLSLFDSGFISSASSTVAAQLTTQGLQVEGVFNASSTSLFSGDALFLGNVKIGLGTTTPTATSTQTHALEIQGGVSMDGDIEVLNSFYVKPRTATYTGVTFDLAKSVNVNDTGITQYGGYFWVTDDVLDRVFKYTTDGTYTGVTFNLAASGNGDSAGITQYGGYFWVVDNIDKLVYKYAADGTYTGVTFDLAASGNSNAFGITQYGGYFWVTDNADALVYKYTTDGTYTGVTFNLAGNGNSDAIGITQYGGYFWVTDLTDDLVYKYAIQADTYVQGQRSASSTPSGGTDFVDSLASFGIGTSSPWGLLSVHASSTNILIDPLFVVASTTPLGTNDTLFVIKSSGNVGIASTSPAFLFSIDGAAYVSDTLFVGNAITATSTLTVGDLSTLTGFISTASSTIGGPFYVQDHLSASSTSSFGGLSLFDSGFISTASSTVSAPLHITDIIAGSSTLAIDKDAYFALTGGSVGIASSTPWGLLSVLQTGTEGVPAFVVADIADDTSPFIITETGNVKVGTTTAFHPTSEHKLELAGRIKTSAGFVIPADDDFEWWLGSFADSTSWQLTHRNVDTTWTNALTIDTANRVGLGGGPSGGDFNPDFILEISSTTPAWGYFGITNATDGDIFLVNASGNVGIGTASPNEKLDVNGTVQIRGSSAGFATTQSVGMVDFTNAGQRFLSFGADASTKGIFSWYQAGQNNASGGEVMRISNTGNVGIGTTNPNSILTITTSASAAIGPVFTLSNPAGVGGAGSAIDFRGTGNQPTHARIYTIDDGVNFVSDIRFQTKAAGTGGALSDKMTILAGGNVGIGTTNPAQLLHLSGADTSILIRVDRTGAYTTGDSIGQFIFTYAGDSVGNLLVGRDGANDAGFLTLGTQPTTGSVTERLRITSTGNVGIGTTSPSAALSVTGTGEYVAYIEDVAGDTSPFVIDGAGNVGIGTASPTTLVHLKDSSVDSSPVLSIENDARRWSIGVLGSDSDKFRIADNTAVANRIVIDSSGNVGIGTAAPIRPLEITNNSSSNSYLVNVYPNKTTINRGVVIGTSGGQAAIAGRVSNPPESESFLILNPEGQSVGIGTTNPGARLDVTGAIYTSGQTTDDANLELGNGRTGSGYSYVDLHGDTTYSDYGLRLLRGNSGANTDSELAHRGTGGLLIRAADTGRVSLGSDNSEDLTIISGGNVGIGDTSPDEILDVEGTDATDNIVQFQNLSADAEADVLWLIVGSGNADAGNDFIQFHDNAGGSSMIGAIEGATGATVAYQTTSDRRLKTNIKDLGDGLDLVLQMKPREFDWISSGEHDRGFIAQELKEIYPNVVSGDESGSPQKNPMGVDYGKLTPVLTAAVREIGTRIDLTSAPTTTPSIYITADGSVGIGTSTPAYPLQVAGDIAATGFINTSSRTFKKDVTEISVENSNARTGLAPQGPSLLEFPTENSWLGKIKNLPLFTYRYTYEAEDAPLRMGLIAEESPAEVLSADKKGVDLYKLVTFTIGGVKELIAKVDDLSTRITRIENANNANVAVENSNARTGLAPQGPSLLEFSTAVLESFSDFGMTIADGVAHFTKIVVNELFVQKLVVENITAHALTLGSAENRAGITFYDKNTGEPYCLSVADGNVVTAAGRCDAVENLSARSGLLPSAENASSSRPDLATGLPQPSGETLLEFPRASSTTETTTEPETISSIPEAIPEETAATSSSQIPDSTSQDATATEETVVIDEPVTETIEPATTTETLP